MLHNVGEPEFPTKAGIKVHSSCSGMVCECWCCKSSFHVGSSCMTHGKSLTFFFFLIFVLFFRMDSSRRLSEMISLKTESCSVL